MSGGTFLQIPSPFHCILDFGIVDFMFLGNGIFLTPIPKWENIKIKNLIFNLLNKNMGIIKQTAM